MVRAIHNHLRKSILAIIKWFYPPFKGIMPYQTFQYAACGGGNTVLNILLYFICYNFVLKKQNLQVGSFVISSHIAAFIIAFLVTFPIGFYLNMFVVFKGSELKKRIQLFRYFLVVIACILFNYLLLSLFVEKFNWYPTPSMIVATIIITLFSYFSQQHFSFKKS
jgi:putative flippase GtrA